MSIDNQQIMAQIDALVENKTFSLDAVGAIAAMRESLNKVIAENERIEKRRAELSTACREHEFQLAKKDQQIKELLASVSQLEKTAREGEVAIHDAKKHEAVAQTWQKAMEIVFKPNTVREKVISEMPVSIPVTNGPGYVMNYQGQKEVERSHG